MRLAESLECANCNERGPNGDAWHTLFKCSAFQLYWEDLMTTLQEMDEQLPLLDSLVSIMLRSAEWWISGHLCIKWTSLGAAEVTNSHHHPAFNARPQLPPPVFAISSPATEQECGPGWSTSTSTISDAKNYRHYWYLHNIRSIDFKIDVFNSIVCFFFLQLVKYSLKAKKHRKLQWKGSFTVSPNN